MRAVVLAAALGSACHDYGAALDACRRDGRCFAETGVAGGGNGGGGAAGGAGLDSGSDDAGADAGSGDAGFDAGFDAGGLTGAPCDLLGSTCAPGYRCGWNRDAGAVCSAPGAQRLHGSCMTSDECAAGLLCESALCKPPCALAAGCDGGFSCFDVEGGFGAGVGVCEPTCDPFSGLRNFDRKPACGTPDTGLVFGCYGPSRGEFICMVSLGMGRHGEVPAVPWMNQCASGHRLLELPDGGGPMCDALCDATAGRNLPGGQPPYDCATRGATSPTEECRYFGADAGLRGLLASRVGYCFDYAAYSQPSCADADDAGVALEHGCAPAP